MSGKKNRDSKHGKPLKVERYPNAWWLVPLTIVIALFGLYGIFNSANASRNSNTTGQYDVAYPGPGKEAPAFNLTSDSGQQVSLKDYQGKNVLLYFQEGLTCPPCWDQMTVLEKQSAKLKAAGVDELVSITSDPVDLISRKVSDMGLKTLVLSDPTMAISNQYEANRYGMMGNSRDGHTFILVGPDGIIRWRADYGGPPNYTMFVPIERLLKDMRAGIKT